MELRQINAYCGNSDCRRCTPVIWSDIPTNIACSYSGPRDDVYRLRQTLYDAFRENLKYICSENGWNHYEIIRGVFPDDSVRNEISRFVSEYRRLDAEVEARRTA